MILVTDIEELTNIKELTNKIKSSFSLIHGHIPPKCLNDKFIMDKEFCLSKGDFKIMRESVQCQTGVTIPFKKFENASIADITNIVLTKLQKLKK